MRPEPECSVLVVDDDEAMCDAVSDGLRRRGFVVETCTTGQRALELASRRHFSTIVADINMPDTDGLQLCRELLDQRSEVPVVLITAFGSFEAAVEAIRAGAYDFITKPVELEILALAIRRASAHAALRDEVRRLREIQSPARSFGPLIGDSAPMRRLYELVERAASSSATVLITGESGVGKELVARSIHDRSPRAEEPFVAINCAAVPDALIESELFGHLRGAFTDARTDHAGLFARAHRGTLFLDEIGELPMAAQAKVLRALQERSIRPVGATEEQTVDVRILAATNRDLESLVEEKSFREDLFYRLEVVTVTVPPLRARGNDILVLAQEFVRSCSARENKKVTGLTSPVVDAFLRYPWPGNVRELRNCVERAVVLTEHDQIVLEDLPDKLLPTAPVGHREGADETDGFLPMHEIERRYLLRVLEAFGGNKSEAARVLGLDRRTIRRKLDAYGIA
jgi:two-component system response regulator HydG